MATRKRPTKAGASRSKSTKPAKSRAKSTSTDTRRLTPDLHAVALAVRKAAELEAKKKGKLSKLDVQHLDDLAVAKHWEIVLLEAGNPAESLRFSARVDMLEKKLRVGRYHSRVTDAEARAGLRPVDDEEEPGDFGREAPPRLRAVKG